MKKIKDNLFVILAIIFLLASCNQPAEKEKQLLRLKQPVQPIKK